MFLAAFVKRGRNSQIKIEKAIKCWSPSRCVLGKETLTELLLQEGGDPYLHSQIKQFALAKFPRPPTTMLKQLLDGAPGSLLKESYGMLQFAAVHLSSTERDEVDYEGQYPQELDDLQEGSNGLRALMCSVRMAMRDAGVEPDKDVEKSLKTIDLSPIRDASQRNLRDILRLDGASAILNYIYRVFSALYDRSDSWPELLGWRSRNPLSDSRIFYTGRDQRMFWLL